MAGTHIDRPFRLLPTLAIAAAAATSVASANEVLLSQRVVQVNGELASYHDVGEWYQKSNAPGTSAWQSSFVDPFWIAANGASAATGLGSIAGSSLLHVLSIDEPSIFKLEGYVVAYSESVAGIIAGNCTITLSGPSGVLFSASQQSEPPFYETVEFDVEGLLPPGVYTLTVSGTTVGLGGPFGPAYSAYASFAANLSVPSSNCAGQTASSCLLPHPEPGCGDSWCCATVCVAEPFCCDVQWDTLCASIAANCDLVADNAECADALPLVDGAWIGNLGASGELEVEATCTGSAAASFFGPVYYTYTAEVTGPVAIELGAELTFDAILGVFVGPCDALTLIACDSSSSTLEELPPRVVFDAICGATYTIVLGSAEIGGGVAVVSIDATGSCGSLCPADVNGDGIVGPTDLGELLGAWGTASANVDLDDSGDVGAGDLAILLGAWGLCD